MQVPKRVDEVKVRNFVFKSDTTYIDTQRKRINKTRFLAFLCSRKSVLNTLSDVSEFVKENKMSQVNQTHYFAFLCSQVSVSNTLDDVKEFIKDVNKTGKEMGQILNQKHDEFNGGTVLHIAVNCNGNLGIELFELLVEHGAIFCKNYYGEYPWEQKNILNENACNKIRTIYKK